MYILYIKREQYRLYPGVARVILFSLVSQAMPYASDFDNLSTIIKHNCEVSDARDHGIYSMCSMVLKLRNLYKFEHGLEPWEEPDSADLLDWIERKEAHWQELAEQPFQDLVINFTAADPFEVEIVNAGLAETGLFYGAGYGRSMKTIFFLAEVLGKRSVEGCPVTVLGNERVREMASPFAMVQDNQIIIRLDPLRFFLWDHIQELRSSCRSSYRYTLQSYGLLKDDALDQQRFRTRLDQIVDTETEMFIHHEVGEMLQDTLDSRTLRTIIGRFPSSVIEFVCRAVKDILADTHPRGVLSYISREEKDSSLGLYVSFLDGLRQKLFPEMAGAWDEFVRTTTWEGVELARRQCRSRTLALGEEIVRIEEMFEDESDTQIQARFNDRVLQPLGLDLPTG
jgi:hypothetical protein